MACILSPSSFSISITTNGSPAGGQSFPFNPSSVQCNYHYTVSYTITINGSDTEIDTPVGAFFASTSGSTTQTLTGSQILTMGWQPNGPPFSVPLGETATLDYTLDSADDPTACWTITGIKKNGKKWQRMGPNRTPSKIHIPKDVDPESCVIIEDGQLVPKTRYELIHE